VLDQRSEQEESLCQNGMENYQCQINEEKTPLSVLL